jgi:DNA-binding MarR family transcriptional regulator
VHGRIQQIEVTALGRQLLAASRGKVKRVEDELLAGLSAAEEKTIRRWLVRIADTH